MDTIVFHIRGPKIRILPAMTFIVLVAKDRHEIKKKEKNDGCNET